MKLLVIIPAIFILTSSALTAQDTITVYYDKNWEEIQNANNASFYRKAFLDTTNLWMAYDYYINGQIQMICPYVSKKLKKREGKAIYFFENGNKSSEGEFIKDSRTGEWTFWFESGEIKAKGKYDNDLRTGIWHAWYENGQLMNFGKYMDGRKDSTWVYYYETGEMKEMNDYFEDLIVITGFHKNGNKRYLGKKRDGYKHSEWKYWNDEERLTYEGFYGFGGLKTGQWVRYFKEGKMEISYKDGQLEGKKFGGMVRARD